MKKKGKRLNKEGVRVLSLFVPRYVYEKMLFVARLCAPNEVQMLGEIVEGEDMKFAVEKVHLISQGTSPHRAEFNDAALAEFLGSHQHPEKLWFWMHSHVEMGNFWSVDDKATIDRLLGGMDKLMSLVMCVDGTCLARFDFNLSSLKEKITKIKWVDPDVRRDIFKILFLPTRVHWDEITVEIESFLSDEEKVGLTAEVGKKVKAAVGVDQVLPSHSERELDSENGDRCEVCIHFTEIRKGASVGVCSLDGASEKVGVGGTCESFAHRFIVEDM